MWPFLSSIALGEHSTFVTVSAGLLVSAMIIALVRLR